MLYRTWSIRFQYFDRFFLRKSIARRTSCARGDTICPRPLYAGRCGPAAAHPLCLRRSARLDSKSAMNINELMNINDVRESATIFPRPCKLTFDLLTLKVVSESRVTWATCVPILVFAGRSSRPLCSRVLLFPMYATDRQTDVSQHHRLMPPPRGGDKTNKNEKFRYTKEI